MRKIKLGFCGFWNSFNPLNNLFTNILSKYFEVEVCDFSGGVQQPDFLICSNRGLPFEYAKYDCIRIMFMGENISPDFTAFDYVIGFDEIDFADRYFRFPFVFYANEPYKINSITRSEAKEIARQKKYFCNFIYRHPSSHGMREKLFEELQKYKNVISPGKFMNNCGTSGCTWKEKYQYLTESKFTIAGDSIAYPGFTTEKIMDPFRFHSIPIYCGNPCITKEFNPEAFIEYKIDDDMEFVLEQVIKVDTDEDTYIKMLTEPIFYDQDYLDKLYEELEAFLLHIFRQSPDEARRRIQFYAAKGHNDSLKHYHHIQS